MRNNFSFKLLTLISDITSRQIGLNSADITKRFLKKTIAHLSEPVIFDIGANIGEFSASCVTANKASKIYAFEPQKELCNELKVKLPPTSEVFSLAFSNSEGFMEIARNKPGDRKAHMKQEFEISDLIAEKTTIDNFLVKHSIEKIDLLKIDTEGHDFNVLLGAQASLTAGKIGTVVFEIMPRILTTGTTPKMIESFLRESGYTHFFRITPHLGLMPLETFPENEIRTQNIVCIRD